MSKIMYVNGNNAIIAGTVKSVKEDAEKVSVRLCYKTNVKDASGNWNEVEKTVDVYVRNQDPREDGTAGINYADRARRMNMKAGSSVIAYVRFTDSERKNATGYGFKYDGVLSIQNGYLVKDTGNGKQKRKPASDEEKAALVNEGYQADRNFVVKGLVTSVKKKLNSLNEEFLSISVYVGKDKDGHFMSEHIQVKNSERNKNAVANAEKVLSPRKDGTKIAAAFLCGAPYSTLVDTPEGELDELLIYTAYDFSTTGQKTAA